VVFRESFTSRVFPQFLRRLLRHARRPVFLILDRHPVHPAAEVAHWVPQRADRLRLSFLPGCSSDLNPDEFLNQDVKSNALGRRRARDAAELLSSVRSYLRSTQRQPAVVQSYFHAPNVQYAAL
jgi:hypothetical protein